MGGVIRKTIALVLFVYGMLFCLCFWGFVGLAVFATYVAELDDPPVVEQVQIAEPD